MSNHFSPTSSSSFVVPINQHSPLEPQSGFPSPNLSLPGSFSHESPANTPTSSRSYRHSTLLEGGKYHEDWNTRGIQSAQQQLNHASAYPQSSPSSLLPYSSPAPHHRQTRSVGRVPSLGHLQQSAPRPPINHRSSMMIPSSFGIGTGAGGSSDGTHSAGRTQG